MSYIFHRIFKHLVVISLCVVILILFSCSLSAQEVSITHGKGKIYKDFDDRIDYLVMMYDVKLDTEISVEQLPDPSLSVNWYRYPDNQFVSNQTMLNPEDHTGYLLKITGTVNGRPYNKELSVWVIDYKLYQPILNSLSLPDPHESNCTQLTLGFDGVIPEMYYLTTGGSKFLIKREFKLQYETLEWGEDDWVVTQIEQPVELNLNNIQIDNPPSKDTYFIVSGDQFVDDLGVDQFSVQSSLYSSIKTVARIKTETTVRVEKNEGDRPESVSTLSGSAPLDINFIAISNTPIANFFRWEISTGSQPFIVRTGESQRYTFNESGSYIVKLVVANTYCSSMDSVVVKVTESAIYAPNVFTPNGDGINDEFRVAYKSIIAFDCWIFNRWGSKLYHWSDPQKGWDGTVNGKPAVEGAYFYVIKAKGADGIDYNLRGDINLLRGK